MVVWVVMLIVLSVLWEVLVLWFYIRGVLGNNYMVDYMKIVSF